MHEALIIQKFKTSSFLLVNTANLRVKKFFKACHSHTKLLSARIPVEMTGFHP